MPLVFAMPKGRIASEFEPLLTQVGLKPASDYYDDESRSLQFATANPDVSIIRTRAFDVPTFTAYGGAHFGVAGGDVLAEFDYPDLYAPLDLNVGLCRLSLAAPTHIGLEDLKGLSHVRVATKYPNLTRSFFAERGIQAECIKLSGAMELAPKLGLTDYIVDLVSSGQTLKSNGLHELLTISKISSKLIIHRQTYKTQQTQMQQWIDMFRSAVANRAAAHIGDEHA